MDDTKIIELFWNRNEQAITAVSAKYGGYCLTIARNILGSDEDAEECANDTYLRAWNSIPPQKPTILSAFLAKITRNLALNRYKSRTADKRGGGQLPIALDELDFVSDRGDAEKTLDRRELLRAIAAFLDSLPRQKRQIFVCRYWHFDSIGNIAHRFGMSENSVSVTLNRLRANLKTHLNERGFEL